MIFRFFFSFRLFVTRTSHKSFFFFYLLMFMFIILFQLILQRKKTSLYSTFQNQRIKFKKKIFETIVKKILKKRTNWMNRWVWSWQSNQFSYAQNIINRHFKISFFKIKKKKDTFFCFLLCCCCNHHSNANKTEL